MSTKVTTEKIRRLYVTWSDRGEDRRAKEFDAWLAAHDRALREQIALMDSPRTCTNVARAAERALTCGEPVADRALRPDIAAALGIGVSDE